MKLKKSQIRCLMAGLRITGLQTHFRKRQTDTLTTAKSVGASKRHAASPEAIPSAAPAMTSMDGHQAAPTWRATNARTDKSFFAIGQWMMKGGKCGNYDRKGGKRTEGQPSRHTKRMAVIWKWLRQNRRKWKCENQLRESGGCVHGGLAIDFRVSQSFFSNTKIPLKNNITPTVYVQPCKKNIKQVGWLGTPDYFGEQKLGRMWYMKCGKCFEYYGKRGGVGPNSIWLSFWRNGMRRRKISGRK